MSVTELEAFNDLCQRLGLDKEPLNSSGVRSLILQLVRKILGSGKASQRDLHGPLALYLLSALGYPRTDQLLDEKDSLQECLLCFGFLVDKLHTSREALLPPYPLDSALLCTPSRRPRDTSSSAMVCQVLWRLRGEERRLLSLAFRRLTLLRQLSAVQQSERKVTEYEAFVCEDGERFRRHLEALQEDMKRLRSKSELVFWRWMSSLFESVKEEETEEKERGSERGSERGERCREGLLSDFLEDVKTLRGYHATLSAETSSETWRQRWEAHKSLPSEEQRHLRAQLRFLGQRFDLIFKDLKQKELFEPPLRVTELRERYVAATEDLKELQERCATVLKAIRISLERSGVLCLGAKEAKRSKKKA